MNHVLDTSRIKQANIQLILDVLIEHDTLTKHDIAAHTGLGVSTCTALLSELITSEQVVELAYAPPRGGRPARRFSLNADAKHILCMIAQNWEGRDQLIWNVSDLKGKPVLCASKAFETLDYAELERTVASILSEDSAIQSLTLGLPGVIADDYIDSCDISSLSGYNLLERLQTRFKLPVHCENDLNTIAYGLSRTDKKGKKPDAVVVAWPPDNFPGAGIVIEGNVLKGSTHFAGEISHFPYPVSRSAQFEQLHDPTHFLSLAAQVLCGIICILNPQSIAIIGKLATSFTGEQYTEACAQWIPLTHLPRFSVLSDPQGMYFRGLYFLGLENLSYPARS